VGNDLDLSVTNLGDLDDVTEVTGAAVNLDLVLEELLEGGNVEDLVAGWLAGVDDELLGDLGLLALGGFLHNYLLAYCFTPRRHAAARDDRNIIYAPKSRIVRRPEQRCA